MKRLLSLSLTALFLVLALAACGDAQEEDQDPGTQASVTEPQGEDSAETSAPVSAVDLSNVREQIVNACGIEDYVNVETSVLADLYGIDTAGVVSSAGINAPSASGGAFPQEVVMVEAVDAAAAGDIQAKLEGRLATIHEQAASYDADSAALAQRCAVVTAGNFVGLFFSDFYDSMAEAFLNAVS